MATLDELRLTQLLQPFEGPSGIATLNPLAFQYQNPQYPNSTQMFYQPRMDISPTQDFYQPREFVNAPQNYYQPDLTTLRGLDMNRSCCRLSLAGKSSGSSPLTIAEIRIKGIAFNWGSP